MKKMNRKEKIILGRTLIEEISENLLQEGKPFIILESHEYLRDVLTLYSKQTNLLESSLLLLENNHAEEAYVLVRSMLNNLLLIQYLCDDDEERNRHKNYKIQPYKNQLRFLKSVKTAVVKKWFIAPAPSDLNRRIKEREKYLRKEGFIKDGRVDTSLLSVYEMAKQDKFLFSLYAQFYADGSKYEHSDSSSLNIYRQKVLDEISTERAFIMDLSRTDEELDRRVLNLALAIYIKAFIIILQHINKTNEDLIPKENRDALAILLLRLNNIDFEIT